MTLRRLFRVSFFFVAKYVFFPAGLRPSLLPPSMHGMEWKMAENMRPTLEACTEALHSLLAHVPGYEIEDNKVSSVHFFHSTLLRLSSLFPTVSLVSSSLV